MFSVVLFVCEEFDSGLDRCIVIVAIADCFVCISVEAIKYNVLYDDQTAIMFSSSFSNDLILKNSNQNFKRVESSRDCLTKVR